jgi:hypothetical protein
MRNTIQRRVPVWVVGQSNALSYVVVSVLLLAARAALGQIDLNGHWNSAEFGIVRVVQDTAGDVYVLAPQNDKCGRSVYLSGFLEGDQLTGTMWRCTDPELVSKCGHQKKYPIDFTATVTRSDWPFAMGRITIDTQQINPRFQMQYWNTTSCKEEKVQPLNDLILRDTWTTPRPTPTPTPTPPQQYQTGCGWTTGFFDYLHCLGWEWGVLDSPYPNGTP